MRSVLDYNHKYSAQLLAAVLERDINTVLQFLQKGAKANVICCADGHTAVGMAAALGDHEILRLLIQFSDERPTQSGSVEADTIENTPEGMDELEWDDEFPLEGVDTSKSNAEMDESTSLYHYYAKTLEATGTILNSIKVGLYAKDKRKDDPHVADKALMTPLHYAAAYGHTECVDILIESGCKINPENAEGFTPLHFGTKFYDIALKLLENNADPSVHSFYTNETALHMAVRHQNLQVVELLLKYKNCDINAVNSDHRTPLICAIRSRAWKIVTLLLEHKPLVNVADSKGQTALYYAVTYNKVDLARRLLKRRARRLPEHYMLHHCVRQNNREMAELLIMNGDSLGIRDVKDLTPIMVAIQNGDAEMLEFLLKLAVKTKSAACTNNFFYLGNELFLAVDRTRRVGRFKSLVKVLFAYTMITYTEAVEGCCCREVLNLENSLYTPLAHAIQTNRLTFAEYMIKEGIDIKFACSEHSIMHLGRICLQPGVLEFTRFLVYNGFRSKHCKVSRFNFWTLVHMNYELSVKDLLRNPLPLKVLTRIVIRRCLTQKPFGLDMDQTIPTESFMFNRIKKLGLPNSLQSYLYHFPDCPMKFWDIE